jgi:type II secretory ATPase GspE/PulE/Tfp pilus assembly ATPase PilB-like protein
VSRIKVLGGLDIAEKRKPQDGRCQLKAEGRAIDLRVSTIPTQFGEKAVLRLLDSSNALLPLERLGLEAAVRGPVEKLIRAPHGIVLVTGPTGSGKTTTLYAMLHLINAPTLNIVTIEDPVEYRLAGVNQVQVNTKADVTFASALRSFLRQDPNVIMVGEIRDRETAEIAIQASLTGHLVLSTLHTNDAPSSLSRLVDMGIEPFLVATSLAGILAQRLVRVVCPKCKEPYRPDGRVLQEIGAAAPAAPPPAVGPAAFVRGKGCSTCKQSGYQGRVGIYELLQVSDEIKGLVASKAPAHVIRDAARRTGMRTLREDGMAKAAAGITTIEEVLRVTQLE